MRNKRESYRIFRTSVNKERKKFTKQIKKHDKISKVKICSRMLTDVYVYYTMEL